MGLKVRAPLGGFEVVGVAVLPESRRLEAGRSQGEGYDIGTLDAWFGGDDKS